MRVIYLCGAIEGLDRGTAYNWRKEARAWLSDCYKVLDPMDNDEGMTRKEIFEADIQNVEEADIILCEMSHHNMPYIGSSMELWHAYQLGKKIILWGRANNEHLFLEQIVDIRLSTLAEAIYYLRGDVRKGEKN